MTEAALTLSRRLRNQIPFTPSAPLSVENVWTKQQTQSDASCAWIDFVFRRGAGEAGPCQKYGASKLSGIPG